jgi:molecular chaperone DnaJ
VQVQQITTCPSCAGRGQKIDEPCRRCAGAGQVEQEESLAVQIPVGAEEGMALRLPGKGLPSHERGDPPGDLYVVVRTRADRRFVRRGADLWRDEALDLPDAVLGTTLEVPTLDGPVSVRVPPGAQPSSVLRLRAKGLPEFGGGPRGDLYVQLTVRVPERLSREERKLYERLRALAGKASPEA